MSLMTDVDPLTALQAMAYEKIDDLSMINPNLLRIPNRTPSPPPPDNLLSNLFSPTRLSQRRPREDVAPPTCPSRRNPAADRTIVSDTSDRLGLTQRSYKQLEDLIEMDLCGMVIVTIAEILKHRKETAAKESSEFMNSAAFKTDMVLRLKSILMSPDLFAYVMKLADYVLDDMRKHHNSWGIPKSLLENPKASSEFKSQVRKTLTDWRGKTWEKIEYSRTKGTPVWELASLVAPQDYVVDKSHYVCFAILRLASAHHDILVQAGKAKKGSYWMTVDKLLAEIRAFGDGNPPDQKVMMRNVFITTIYNADLTQYPGDDQAVKPSSLQLQGNPLDWQVEMERVISRFNFDDTVLREDVICNSKGTQEHNADSVGESQSNASASASIGGASA